MRCRAIVKLHYRCNNNCLFCHSAPHRRDTQSVETVCAKIEKAAGLGVTQVLFSGGEPTAYRPLQAILARTKELGLACGLVTNGRMLAYPDLVRLLVSHGASYFYVSLHSARPAIHDLLTRAPGSWEQTVAGLRTLVRLAPEAEIVCNCVVTKLNAGGLAELPPLLASLGIERLKFSIPEIKGNAVEHAADIVIDLPPAAAAIRIALSACGPSGVEGSYDGVPFCLMDPADRARLDDLETAGIDYMSEAFEEGFARTDTSERDRIPACRLCSYHAKCEGVYRGYADKTGDPRPIVEKIPSQLVFSPALSPDTGEPVERSFRGCLREGDGELGRYPFKRAAVLVRDTIRLYEAENGFYPAKVAEECVRTGALFAIDPGKKPGDMFFDRLTALEKIGLCRGCDEACAGIYAAPAPAGRSDREWLARLLRSLSGRVLDVGFGDACFGEELFGNPGVAYYGLEPDEARFEKLRSTRPALRLFRTTLEEFAWEESFFDAILFLGSYNHIALIADELRHARALLKAGGLLVVAENDFIGLVTGGGPWPEASAAACEHYRNHGPEEAEQVIAGAGFEIARRDAGGLFWSVVGRKA